VYTSVGRPAHCAVVHTGLLLYLTLSGDLTFAPQALLLTVLKLVAMAYCHSTNDALTFDFYCSNSVEEYVLGATALGAKVPKAKPTGLLLPLKLQSSTTGFFKPLTGDVTVQDPSSAHSVPMVGCQITVQGAGVQWITDEVHSKSFCEFGICSA